jgi:predicted RNA-binding protein with PIN domain
MSSMSLLIDGYNLLHASGILGGGVGPGSLERSRNALLNFIAESLTEKVLAGTTVVFDAREAPPGLPRQVSHRGITVQFAPRGSDADAEIEQLIEDNHAPRRLIVVSSDHRLHRAARRRRAKAIDSDVWYAETVRLRIERSRTKKHAGKPTGPPSEVEVKFWLRQFGLEEPDAKPKPRKRESNEPPVESPFPPGYAEDIREEDV